MKLLAVLLAFVVAVSSASEDHTLFGSLTPDDAIPLDNDSPTSDFWKHFFSKEFFPSMPHRPMFPSFPSPPESFPGDISDLPEGYNNTSHEVKFVNGSRIEVNQTISKGSEDGVVFTQIVIKVSSSSGKDRQTNGNAVSNDHLGLVPSTVLNRNRRGLFEWFKKSIAHLTQRPSAQPVVSDAISPVNDKHAEEFTKSNSQPLPVPAPENRNDVVSYIGDTDVNYVGPQPRNNPDAEVFDVNLLREDANRFFSRQPQPVMSQPLKSQPIRSQLIRSQPMRSQAMRYQPMRSQPMRSMPIRSQPMRSMPMRSQPIRAH